MGKSTLVAKPIVEAHTRHQLAPSRVSEPIIQFGRFLIPFYLRFVLSFRKIEIRDPEMIIEALRHFQEQRTRLIVAFRHPYGDEAQLFFHVFDNLIPRLAKKLGKPLTRRPHLRVVHDYAVPLWSDAFIRFLLPRAGAVPVYHIKFDPASLKNIRSVLLDDPCPLGIAPEGQITYHSESLPLIEQGAIRMGFWCARDLERAGRSEKVKVLPISVFCQYDRRDSRKINKVLDDLEMLCGCARTTADVNDLAAQQTRIESVESRVLDMTETFYQQTYNIPSRPANDPVAGDAASRQHRWQLLLEKALRVAEAAFGLTANGADIITRVYRIRQEGWDRIYPEIPVDHLPPLEAALADRRAGEAWYAMRHMEFVDLMSYHSVAYLRGQPDAEPSFDRIVESVVNLQDLVARLMGGNITTRSNVIRKKTVVMPAPCLDLSEYMPEYNKSTRKAVRDATQKLSEIYLNSIKEYLHGTQA